MSALDLVLQRQVPARAVAKTGEAATGADPTADSRNGAFSAALSQEKRNAVAERDKIESQDKKAADKTGADAEGDEPDDQVMSETGQSDDILNLLAGLTSGPVNPKTVDPSEAELTIEAGEAKAADPRQVATTGLEKNALADDAAAELPGAANLAKPGATALDNSGGSQTRSAGAKGAPAEPRQTSGEGAQPAPATASPAGSAQVAESQVAARSPAASVAAVASAGAAGMTGKGTQAPPPADAGQERSKDPSTIKETIRALGLERGSEPAEPIVADGRSRGRNMGRQGDTAERQIEDRVGAKGGKVEVIESRRFMPVQPMNANAQLLTRTLVEATSTALAAQSTSSAQPAAQSGPSQPAQMLHTLKLQLNPVSLGAVTAVLKLTGEALSVEIKVETAEAYRQLKDDNQSILKALRGQGFGVDQITIQHVTGPDRSSSQTPQQGFQASQQGTGSNDAQSSGKEGSRNNTGQQGSGPQGGQGHEQSSYSGSGAGRSDGVYL